MWKLDREEYLETVERLEGVQADIANLMNNFGSRIINSITIDDPDFEKQYYDIDLEELDSTLYRLQELLTQYVKENDEYYGVQEAEN